MLSAAPPARVAAGALAAPARLRWAGGVAAAASKGFGKPEAPQRAAADRDDGGPDVVGAGRDRKVKSINKKGKSSMRAGQPAPGAPRQRQFTQAADAAPAAAAPSPLEELAFKQRLAALKAEGDAARAAAAARGGAAGRGASVLDVQSEANAPIDYGAPPPLAQTLLGSGGAPRGSEAAAAEREYAGSTLGPSQLVGAVAAVALGAIFVLTSGGGDFSGGGARRPSAAAAAAAERRLPPEARAEAEKALTVADAALAAAPGDLEALEAAGVLRARLGDFGRAAEQLGALAAARPGDAEVWRVLGETRLAAGDAKAAADGFAAARALPAGRASFEALAGLAAALAADGRPQAGVDAVRAAAADPAQAAALGEVEVGLLLAKSYLSWRGHEGDALLKYDELAAAHPDDFRIPLAKGLALRAAGREGDAARFLLQARFLAPPASRGAVEALAAGGS
jgi:hypothetical protein